MLNLKPKPKSVEKKQGWVNYAKGIAILLVVYKHVLLGLESRLLKSVSPMLDFFHIIGSNFRMPLFFLLSGIFYAVSLQRHTYLLNMQRKFASIYYPFLIWGVIQISLQVLFAGSTNSDRSFKDIQYLITNPRQIDQFWYLATLFYVNILFTLIYLGTQKKNGLLLVSSIIMFSIFMWNPFVLSSIVKDVFYYQLFFVIGYLISGLMLNADFQKGMNDPIIILGAALTFILSLVFEKKMVNYSFSSQFLIVGFNIFSGIFLVYALSIFFESKRKLVFLAFIGQHSLYIYIMHVILSGFFRSILIQKLGVTNIYILLLIMLPICLLIPILIYRLCVQMKMKWMFNGDWLLRKTTINYVK